MARSRARRRSRKRKRRQSRKMKPAKRRPKVISRKSLLQAGKLRTAALRAASALPRARLLSLGNVIPRKVRRTLEHHDWFNAIAPGYKLSATVYNGNKQGWCANGPYDPYYATGGGQAHGFSELMDLYSYHRVISSTISVTFRSTRLTGQTWAGDSADSAPIMLYIKANPLRSESGGADVNGLTGIYNNGDLEVIKDLESGQVPIVHKFVQVGQLATKGPVTLKMAWSADKFFPKNWRTRNSDASLRVGEALPSYAQVEGVSPLQMFHVGVANMDEAYQSGTKDAQLIAYDVHLTYDVEFMDPKQPTEVDGV